MGAKYKHLWGIVSVRSKAGTAYIREFIRWKKGSVEDVLYYRTKPPYEGADIVIDGREAEASLNVSGFEEGKTLMDPHEFSSFPDVLQALKELRKK